MMFGRKLVELYRADDRDDELRDWPEIAFKEREL